jgi:nicotine blue oxidoreductase
MSDPTGAGEGIGAVVLAAGGSTRFGQTEHKLLAPLRGRPLVAWAVEAAVAAALDAVVVVTGAVDLDAIVETASDGRATVVRNDAWKDGQATSLHTGLEWCTARGLAAAVVGLGDQPLVGSAAWRAVAAATHSPIATATFGGQRRPPVRLDRSVWRLLPTEGDEGARALMRQRPELVTEVPCDGDPVDVDTPADLAAASGQEPPTDLHATDGGSVGDYRTGDAG